MEILNVMVVIQLVSVNASNCAITLDYHGLYLLYLLIAIEPQLDLHDSLKICRNLFNPTYPFMGTARNSCHDLPMKPISGFF